VTPILAVRNLGARYGKRPVFHDVGFDVDRGRALGVLGPNGAGKTTLLRVLAGLIRPAAGEVRIDGVPPPVALSRVAVAYFGGEATLPGIVQASRWSSLTTGEPVVREPRRIRALSRGSRQMLGLRTVLARHPLALVLLDEPWEGLDPDGARWLSSTLQTKRDRGAAVVLTSHYLQDLAGVCDEYLFLVGSYPTLLKAHEIAPVGPVTPALLTEVYDRLRGGPPTLRLSRSALTA
jgi:ABC-type multidrug transport system ATPase subunit